MAGDLPPYLLLYYFVLEIKRREEEPSSDQTDTVLCGGNLHAIGKKLGMFKQSLHNSKNN